MTTLHPAEIPRLTGLLVHAVGSVPVTRTRARIVMHGDKEICWVDVAASSTPVWAKTSKADRTFFVRLHNSTREMPEGEVSVYLAERWPGGAG